MLNNYLISYATNQNLSQSADWLHYILCGIDNTYIGKSNTIVGILFRLFPDWWSYALFMFIQRFVSGFFMFLLCRKILNLGFFSSLASGMIYPLTVIFTPFTLYNNLAEPGLPLFIYFLECIKNEKRTLFKWGSVIFIGIFFGMSNSVFYSLPFAGLIIFVWFSIIRPRPITWIISTLLPFFLMSAIVHLKVVINTYSIVDITERVHRAYHLIEDDHNAIYNICYKLYVKLHLACGDFFSLYKIPSLLLIFSSTIWGSLKRPVLRSFLFLSLFCGIFAYFIPILIIDILNIKLGYQTDRFYIFSHFFIVLSLAVAIDHIINILKKNSVGKHFYPFRLEIVYLAICISIFLILLNTYHFLMLFQIFRNEELGFINSKQAVQILFTIISIVIIRYYYTSWRNSNIRLINISVCFIIPALALSVAIPRLINQLNSNDRYNQIYNKKQYEIVADQFNMQNIFRVATAFPDEDNHPLFALVSGLETVDGYANLYPVRYYHYWQRVIEGVMNLSSSIRDYFISWGQRLYLFSTSMNSFLSKPEGDCEKYFNLNLLSLANVKYIFSKYPLNNNALRLYYDSNNDQIDVYENKECLPRFYIVNKMMVFPELDLLLDSLKNSSIEQIRNYAFVEMDYKPPLPDSTSSLVDVNIRIEHYSSENIELTVASQGNVLLIITNNWSPFWKAKVNNELS